MIRKPLTLALIATVSLATLATASTDYKQDVRRILAAREAPSATATKAAWLSGAKDGSVYFKRVWDEYRKIRDEEKAPPAPPPPPAPVPEPVPPPPPPPPPPAPAPTPAPTPAPAPATIPTPGLDMVADGIDVAAYLTKSWGTGAIPPSSTPDVVGAFRFICQPGQLAFDDPIVYPGQPGKSHLHQFFGNTGANANSTYASLRTSGSSTCGNFLNRSAYWMPAMMNGKGMVVSPNYVSIYYKRRPASDPECAKMAKACVQIPRGLRFVFGYDMLNPMGERTGAGYFNCDGVGAIPGHYPSIVDAAKNCPIGAHLGAVISSPECWNGKDLDSPNHRSHVAYTVRDVGTGRVSCPATHPYMIAQFTLGAWWDVDADLDRSGTWDGAFNSWHLSSDDMPGMPMKPGTSFHADWFGAWNDEVLAMWENGCINLKLNCSGADLGNGKQLKQGYPDKWTASPHLVPIPPRS